MPVWKHFEMTDQSLPDSHSLPLRFSQRRQWAADQSISYLIKQGLENRNVISLAAGFVDETTLPVAEVRDSINRLLTDDAAGRHNLQYATTAGDPRLRSLLLEHLAYVEQSSVDALGVSTGDVMVTAGSQQLLNHIADIVLDPGDICLVSGPTYFVFLGALAGVGARTIAIESDESGMKMDALEAELTRIEAAGELDRVKMIYLVSWFENPSGVSLSAERRQQVVEIAKRWSKQQRILILEDAAYRELRYEGGETPSIWSFDESRQQVILAQTFSKSFSPGVRVGYGVVPRDLIEPLLDIRGNLDFGAACLPQQILADALHSGAFKKHVEHIRQSYRIKRDAMLSAADEFFSDIPGVSWHHPQGGLYVWMTLPDEIETGYQSPLFQRVTRGDGVMYVPGEICYPSGSSVTRRTQMRLSFGVEAPATIREGMRRLSDGVKAVAHQS